MSDGGDGGEVVEVVEGPVVLVAEDSATVRAALRMHLVQRGYSVVEACDGEQALAAARAKVPDAILLDVEMPVLDGYAVLAQLREDGALCDVPVVFLSGHTDPAEIVAGLDAGAHDYLHKPFDPAELLARVQAAVRVKQLQDELRRRNDELDFLSRLDTLTGLFIRRHLEERLVELCGASKRHGFPVSVLMLDLDHFKDVNDTYGHPTGDAVLRAAAESVLSHMRAEDVPGRWGGEELLVVLPYIDAAGALAVAERTRAAVEALAVDVPGSATGQQVRVTASIGVCTQERADPTSLIDRADRAMYQAKSEGRNRIVVAHDH
jgi:diguanylate cyclase (GGDEF)-like protein